MYFKCKSPTNKEIVELLEFFAIVEGRLNDLEPLKERDKALGLDTSFACRAYEYCKIALAVKGILESRLSPAELEVYQQLYLTRRYDRVNTKNIKQIADCLGLDPKQLRKAKAEITKTLKQILDEPVSID